MGKKRWVRYCIPVMVQVDCDEDEVTRIVSLPEEAREDRDDLGHFLFYDERFVRQDGDGPDQVHALWVANPPYGRPLPGPPLDWPDADEWEIGFDLTEADERYLDINPYAPYTRPRGTAP